VHWTDAFDATGEGPGVFAVAPAHRGAVVDWAVRRGLPAVATREVGAPAVDAWGVLDGGVLRLHPHSRPGALAPGVRVVGWCALRLAAGELGFDVPAEALPGEPGPVPDAATLHRRAAVTVPPDPAPVEQAEMLATCIDATTLRWVASALAATPVVRPVAPSPRPRHRSQVGGV